MKTTLAVLITLAFCGLAAAAKQSPFYCDMDALDSARRTRHFDVLGPELVAKREAVRELRDGFEIDFASDPATFQHLVEWIDGERECCPFFDISVRVQPEHGSLTMRITGRQGTKEFIRADAARWVAPVKRPAAAQADGWVGKLAPGFTLDALGGGTVSLAKLHGKVVLVNFWATWCGPCKMEMPWLVDFQRRYADRGLAVVGISLDDGLPGRVLEFTQARGVNYPIALKDAAVAKAYGGVRYLPQSFFVGRDGTIVARSYGISDRAALESEVKRAMARGKAAA
ncbi:MAG TPA: TlpA disulfide reductase family protein [Usitatibacter sp.]|jgi:thiol-disulfide isomerase/thioredoxin|nr:TlpA disulfide reductase family protein [Usitatibacter sp.]